MSALTLELLRSANVARQREWDKAGGIDLSYRGNELAGEVGEACNIIKKLERERLGIRGSRSTVKDLAEELADVVICVDLIAMAKDIDLGEAVRGKFNKTTSKVGLGVYLMPGWVGDRKGAPHPDVPAPEPVAPAPAMHLPAQMDALRDELLVEVERLRNCAISGGATPDDLRFEADRLAFIVAQFVPVRHDDQVGGKPVEPTR